MHLQLVMLELQVHNFKIKSTRRYCEFEEQFQSKSHDVKHDENKFQLLRLFFLFNNLP